ncbi:DUF4123 domain-containing protein [Janthinobacterium agaricidamnosum]|uniref:DUF4123 domain-containing protein n=1 Tax=Janthinobacterium agaricidamnosum NBRC 102515 = DSM 9628 TaxID=1349767 RepID=W0V6A0_9BURK|nr:DUF4123 domain-containing protein [Janthinobacterium agaricidamnosum]CDG84354.1 hypothetical protein GJA_3739 [Janthinobacterium agaricidamnosum NBRC 102515 = DSM 9628]
MQWYALVDAAQVPELHRQKSRALDFPHANLFSLSKEHGIAKYGPLLFPLEAGARSRHPLVALLLQGMRYGWTVSWLSSTLPMDALAKHLAGHLNGMLDDDKDVLLRYYDARLLPAFVQHLPPEASAALLAPVAQWIYWDRQLRLACIEGGRQADSPGVRDTAISAAVQAAMAHAALGDLICSTMYEEADASEFEQWLPHAFYSAVQRKIDQARRFGLKEVADLQLFASLALQVHPDFHQLLSSFQHEQANLASGKISLVDVVHQVPDREWERLGASGVSALRDWRLSINQQLAADPAAIL